MKVRPLIASTAALLMCCTMNSLSRQRDARPEAEDHALPPGATQCDLSLPIQVDLVPLGIVRAGQPMRFQVDIESSLDPDLIRAMWLEYELPEKAIRVAEAAADRPQLQRSGHSRLELGIIFPNEDRHRIRARLMVQLNDGRTISQTATRWINPDKQPPEGMIGRIENPDGSGIRVYQGVTVR